MITGTCEGGPLDGQRISSRFPKGLLVVNRRLHEVAIYDIAGEEDSPTFVVRETNGNWRQPEISDIGAPKNRFRAALEPNYDVVAYDPDWMGPWE